MERFGWIIPVLVIAALGYGIWWATDAISPKPYTGHIFSPGQCVSIKISGEQGMVTVRYYYDPLYKVRVAMASHRNTAIFGPPNTENQRYAEVVFHEFELDHC